MYMKAKYLSMAAVMLLAMNSCSDVEQLAGSTSKNSNEISFADPFVGKASTRATGDISSAEALQGTTIKVWGEKYLNDAYASGEYVFNGTDLNYDGNQKYWKYQMSNAPTWQEDYGYDFAGFVPASATANVSYNNGKFSLTNVPAVQLIDNNSTPKGGDDYLVSAVSVSRKGDARNDVALNFSHILSRLSVYAYTNSQYQVDVNSLSLYLPSSTVGISYQEASHNGPSQGNDTWTWSGFTDQANATAASELNNSYAEQKVVETEIKNIAKSEVNATALPKSYFVAPTASETNLYLALTYTISSATDSRTYTRFLPISALRQLKQGYQHNLYVNIAPNEIKFEVKDIEGWEYENAGNNNFINANGHSFGFTAKQNGGKVEGVIMAQGNAIAGSGENPITYSVNSLKKGSTSVTTSGFEISGWYNTPDCSGTPVAQADLEHIYGKYSFKVTGITSEAPENYVLKIQNSLNDVNEIEVALSKAFATMSFTIDMSKISSGTFVMPMSNTTLRTYSMYIDWGDGERSIYTKGTKLTDALLSHTYAEAKEYHVTIASDQMDETQSQMPSICFGYNDNTANHAGIALKSIDSPILNMGAYGYSSVKSQGPLYRLFADCANLESISGDAFSKQTEALSAKLTFASCVSLKSVPANLFANNAKITDISTCFGGQGSDAGCGIEEVPEGLFDSFVNVTDAYAVFYCCRNLKKVPASLFAKMTEVTDMRNLFSGCWELESAPNGLLAHNLKVTKFNYAFANCTHMKVNKDIFIGDGITKENRFASATATINLSGIFSYAGYKLPAGDGNWGTCPDLWNYAFNENGYGWTAKPMVFNQYSTSNWTNGEEMLANQWHKDTPVDLANWKKP